MDTETKLLDNELLEAIWQSRIKGQQIILAIDDDDDILDYIETCLTPHYVIKAKDIATALAAFHNTNPDLIICDHVMPEMTGLNLLKRFRQEDPLHEVPVVMLTGVLDQELELACLKAGATDFIHKPFHEPRLRTRIENQLQIAKLKRQSHEKLQLDAVVTMTNGLAHQINNPLAIIAGMSEVIAKNPTNNNATYTKQIQQAVKRIAAVVATLQKLSHQSSFPPQRWQLGDLEQAIKKAIEIAFPNSEIIITTHQSDQNRRDEVMVNHHSFIAALLPLVENAIENSPVGSPTQICLNCHGNLQELTAAITSQSSMSTEELRNAFVPLYSGHKTHVSAGLGVNLAQAHLYTLGGQLQATSRQGRTSFVAKVPVAGVNNGNNESEDQRRAS